MPTRYSAEIDATTYPLTDLEAFDDLRKQVVKAAQSGGNLVTFSLSADVTIEYLITPASKVLFRTIPDPAV